VPFMVRHAKTRKDSASERVSHAQNRLTSLFEGEVKLASRVCRQRRSRRKTNERIRARMRRERRSTMILMKNDGVASVWQNVSVSVHSSTGVLIARYFKSDRKLPDSQSVTAGRRSMNWSRCFFAGIRIYKVAK